MSLRFKFDSSLEHQDKAIKAVVNVFEGQPIAQSNFEISATNINDMYSYPGIGNNITLNDEQLLSNVHKIQENNNIEKTSTLQGREFSIEMETGTGKTYVYLRSIFELSKHYGFKKFIIVVPSIAIREGVLKSIDIMKEHFQGLYGNEPFNYFIYDSKKLEKVRQFATNNQIQIMIINIQSFSKDIADKDTAEMSDDELKKLNIINRENERTDGKKPIEHIQGTNPIVIIDEPQSVDNTPKAKRAISNLNPIATLRFSATHRNHYNLLYKLDPFSAYKWDLVKRIEVDSVLSDYSFNDAYVKLLETNNEKGIKARVKIHRKKNANIKPANIWVKKGDDLFKKSGERENYREGYLVQDIYCKQGNEHIVFNRGKLKLGDEFDVPKDDIMKAQVKETVEQHLKKERAFKGEKIKVLSLFFIDRVANYRIYNNDGTTSLGKIGKWFEEAYKELTTTKDYKEFATDDISKIHNGYFSRDKKGKEKDTKGNSKDDENTYNLIMREKERLLDLNEPLRFIFSHSALREGWDNPNVFQICTLNESQSKEKKRQEIGRGLRLPVNQDGKRIQDQDINRLTVIANESYEDFANSLQKEFEEDLDIKFGRVKKITFANIIRVKSDGTEKAIGQEESINIFEELKAKGYINEKGDILDTFDHKNPELNISNKYDDINPYIIDEMQQFIFKNRISNARNRKILKFNKQVQRSSEFKALWDKIKHRTRYRITFDTKELINCAVKHINESHKIKPPKISVTLRNVNISEAGISPDSRMEESYNKYEADAVKVLPDPLAYLQKETELTRDTLKEILIQSNRLEQFPINPQKFLSLITQQISKALSEMILKGIQYEKIANHYWKMEQIEKEAEKGIVRYLENLYEVQNEKKCLFNLIETDSEVEKQFATDLDNNQNVHLFVKLPKWFKIDTPIGSYNPDWAFFVVTEREKKLYFVRETKGTLDERDRSGKENDKIKCGEHHFKAIGVDYGVVTKLKEVDF